MIKESNILSLPVLGNNYNLLNYNVANVVYSFENLNLTGLCLGELNVETKTNFVYFSKIKDITEKGITIYSSEDIVDLEEILDKDNLKINESLIGCEIYSKKNQILGTVKDVLIQINSGRILGLIVSEGLVNDITEGYSFLPLSEEIKINDDKITFKQAELELLPQQGGLKKMLGICNEN